MSLNYMCKLSCLCCGIPTIGRLWLVCVFEAFSVCARGSFSQCVVVVIQSETDWCDHISNLISEL